MVIVRKIANKWFRRYRAFFIFGITIFLFQVFLTFKFISISRNSKDQNWQPVPEGSISKSGSSDFEQFASKTKTKQVIKLDELDFTPWCKITGKEAVSAINRAKTQKCKQLIANISCLSIEKRLYPSKLSNLCSESPVGTPLGCFQDEKEYRLLNGFYGNFKNENTPENCVKMCLQSGFPYAGVEFATECFCGIEEPSNGKKLPDSNCNMKCPGNSQENCGGHFTLNVFHTGIKRFTPAPVSLEDSEKNPVRIVFLLTLNGRALRQVKRLLKIIYHKNHFYYIHVDIRQDYLFRKLLILEKRFVNIRLSRKRFATIWGGASLLKMLRTCMNDILHLNWNWDFVLNLSESDYPVKTIDKLTSFLTANRKRNFVKSHGREVQRFIQKQGLDKTFVECDTHMWRVADRKLPSGIQIDGGSDWVALNRNFVQYVAGDETDELVDGLLKIFHHTLLPAESFFHTALRNSIHCETYVDNNLHVTNWKRKLGCKCQYRHVVDWCGCSPNDFRIEDWPRISATETRQLFFARKFEPIVCQSVIDQLENWMYNSVGSKTKSLQSYWQSLYHVQDLGTEPDDALLVISQLAVKNLLKSHECRVNFEKIIEITSYHHKDVYKSTLVKFKTNIGVLELSYNFNETNLLKKVSSSSSVVKRLETFFVSSDYDQKEQISRNFARTLSRHSELNAIYKFTTSSSNYKSYNISLIWYDPSGKIVDSSEFFLDENSLVNFAKFNGTLPHKSGVWVLRMVHKNTLLVEYKFPIITLGESEELFDKFYEIKGVCGVKLSSCDYLFNVCMETEWSSYYPDPKSTIGDVNTTTGTFDLWF